MLTMAELTAKVNQLNLFGFEDPLFAHRGPSAQFARPLRAKSGHRYVPQSKKCGEMGYMMADASKANQTLPSFKSYEALHDKVKLTYTTKS